MKVLVAFEFSQVVAHEFAKKGHDVVTVDLYEDRLKEYDHYKMDVFKFLDMEIFKPNLIIAHPPCTHLAVSGSRWFKKKQEDGRQQEGIDLFMKTWNIDIDKIAVENPVGIMSRIFRKPDQYVQPYEHGDPYTKKTGLWLRGLPKLTPTNIVEPTEGSKMHLAFLTISDKKELSRYRSIFPKGIAQAMVNQWG